MTIIGAQIGQNDKTAKWETYYYYTGLLSHIVDRENFGDWTTFTISTRKGTYVCKCVKSKQT